MTPLEAVPQIVDAVNREMSERLKDLLQTKHIYQRTVADGPEIIKREISAMNLREETYSGILASFESHSFFPGTKPRSEPHGTGAPRPVPTLVLKPIKLFCGSCDTLETFAPIWFGDILNELRNSTDIDVEPEVSLAPGTCIYYLLYQCQTCKAEPEALFVRRDRWTLRLDGRSPIEQVNVPSFVPKNERWLYRDAIIAMHGGKTLAALFYLRTFIEIFARRVTNVSGKLTGDELMAAYNQTLPDKQRDLMPSLRQWYAKLSEAIHAAREDAVLFTEARAAVDQHFEIRGVFKIPEGGTAA